MSRIAATPVGMSSVPSSERGSAVMIVVVFLLALMPLAIIVMAVSQQWQRGAVRFRDLSACEYAAEAGIADARHRLAGKRFRLAPDETTRFEVEVAGRDVRVRADRLSDEVLSLDGEMLATPERSRADLDATGMTGSRRLVYQFRRIEVYLVTAEVYLGAHDAVRAYGVFIREPNGAVQRVGTHLERGFVDPDEE